jgi:hypothetical protein
VGFLQPAPLSFADAEQRAGGNHPCATYRYYDRTGVLDSVATLCPIAEHALEVSGQHHDATNNQNNGGAAKPDLRFLHTKLHLLKRISIDCPWRAWPNVNTGRVKLQL